MPVRQFVLRVATDSLCLFTGDNISESFKSNTENVNKKFQWTIPYYAKYICHYKQL